MGSPYMILFHTISRYSNFPKLSEFSIYGSLVLRSSHDCWFCSTMMLMEKEEMMEIMIIWAGIVGMKVWLKSDACSLIYSARFLALICYNCWGLKYCCQVYRIRSPWAGQCMDTSYLANKSIGNILLESAEQTFCGVMYCFQVYGS